MLVQKGRVQVDIDCHSFIRLILEANNCRVQPITPQNAAMSVQLADSVNQDPADRLIMATAIAEHLPLLTADQNLRAANVVPTIC